MDNDGEKLFRTVAVQPCDVATSAAAAAAVAGGAAAAIAPRQPARCTSEIQPCGAIGPATPSAGPAAAAITPTISAPAASPLGLSQGSLPSCSGGSLQQPQQPQRNPHASESDGPKAPGHPGSATAQKRKSSGRDVAGAAAAGVAIRAAAVAAGGARFPASDDADTRHSSQSYAVAAATATLCRPANGGGAGSNDTAAGGSSALPSARSPCGDELRSPALGQQKPVGAGPGAPLASPPGAALVLGDGVVSSARRASPAAAAGSRLLTSSSSSGRSDTDLGSVPTTPLKPPLPSPPLPSPPLPPSEPLEATACASDRGGGGGSLRPAVKRSSSSGSASGLAAADPNARSFGDGDGVATVQTAAVAGAGAGSGALGTRERRLSFRQMTAVTLPCHTPRESSTSGTAPAASLLLPFRSPSSGQMPPLPLQALNQQPPGAHQFSQPRAQQPLVPQHAQHQQLTTSRAVRFSPRESSASGLGNDSPSPMGHTGALGMMEAAAGAAAVMLPSYRRVSDSSSHLPYSPSGRNGSREVGSLVAAAPPPPGLLPQRRPSDDAVVMAAAKTARRDRASHLAPANVMWALPASALPASAPPAGASGRPASGGSSQRELQRPSVDGGGAAPPPTRITAASGGRRGSGPGVHAGRAAAAAAAAAAGGGGGIRRAVELAPLSLPGGPDVELREALARAAVSNVCHLATGALLPEPDFGYARIVEQHRRQQQRQVEQQLQDQQQKQKQKQQQLQDQQKQQRQSAAGEAGPPGRASRPASLQVSKDAEPEAGAGPGAAGDGGGGDATGAGGSPTGAAAASPPSSPQGASRPGQGFARGGRPPLAAKSMRGVLKTGAPHGGHGGGNGGATLGGAGWPLAATAVGPTHGSAAMLATTSYRLLGLHRASSKVSVVESDGERFSSPGNAKGAAAGGGGRSGWAFGRGDSTTAASAASGADSDPMGLRTAENVDIRIHCLTFNMGGAVPSAAALPESLFSGSYLSPDAAADAAHLYVFSTQESGPLADWEAAVAAHLGGRYTRVAAESLMSIHIVLFAVRSMAPYITDIQTSSVATGVGNVLGNKGGVAVTFMLLGARVLLVGAHFAAHYPNVERRNADFHRICAGLFAPPSTDGAAAAASGGGGGGGGGAASAGAVSGPAASRSVQCTPERQSASDSAGEGDAAPRRTPSEADISGPDGAAAVATAAAAATPPLRNGAATPSRRLALGPTLSRFRRGGGGGVTFNGVDADRGGDEGGDGGGGGGAAAATIAASSAASGGSASQNGRTLTRALSSSSVSSLASNVSAYPAPEGPLRTRTPSFWGGLGSFATAQRQSTALLAHFDVVLWMGDLNYRIAGTPEVVKYAIDENMMEVLRANDQLQKQQKKGKVLQGFLEMPIAFAPTFKFCRGTDDYDLRRSPSWTDRVLYLVNADPLFADLRPLYYMSVPELRTSDHKPVIAGFELSISPQHAGDNRHARQRGCVVS